MVEVLNRYMDYFFPDDGEEKSSASILGLIKKDFSQYIVRPLNAFGLGGFIFDIEGETSHEMKAEITDHYTENNTTIQDHIAIQPMRVILKSAVGELVYREEEESNAILQNITRKLTILNDYLPVFSSATQQAKKFFEKDNGNTKLDTELSAESAALNIWGLVKNLSTPITRQEQAYMYFKALMERKILCSVQTPFAFLSNMAIESIVATQGEDSKFISTFNITLKQMRFAKLKTRQSQVAPVKTTETEEMLENTPNDYGERGRIQREPELNQGATQGLPVYNGSDEPKFVGEFDIDLDTLPGTARNPLEF